MRTIQFYRLPNGECPVETFLDALSGKRAQKVVWVLRLIEELERVPSQYFKKLVNTEGIWEVRAQLGTDAFRLLGFFAEPTVFVLTNGFAKKTQKTPSREIASILSIIRGRHAPAEGICRKWQIQVHCATYVSRS